MDPAWERVDIVDELDPGIWLGYPYPDIGAAVAGYKTWRARRIQLGIPRGSAQLVATGKAEKPWAVEVSERLFEAGQ